MRKFRFNLEGLLTLREWEEQRSRQVLGLVSKEVARLRENLEVLSGRMDTAFDDWSESSAKSFSPAERLALSSQLASIETLRVEAQKSLQQALDRRQAEMDKLALATRKKKVVENLKQKRLEAFRADVFRQEARENEDIFNSRHKGRMPS